MKSLMTLTCSLLLAVSAGAFAGHHAESRKTIVDTAADAGNFETLLAAASAAGLVDALSGDGPLTVFAPTDDAFGALPAGTIATLLEPENRDRLAEILTFHVVSGAVKASALTGGATLTTLAGADVGITETEGGFSIEGARIIATDIDAGNGIVHVIDRVMLPPERLSSREAMRLIEHSIARGAPMFNDGDADGTTRVYTDASRMLLTRAELAPQMRQRLDHGLDAAREADTAEASAWQLRYALDDVMMALARH